MNINSLQDFIYSSTQYTLCKVGRVMSNRNITKVFLIKCMGPTLYIKYVWWNISIKVRVVCYIVFIV